MVRLFAAIALTLSLAACHRTTAPAYDFHTELQRLPRGKGTLRRGVCRFGTGVRPDWRLCPRLSGRGGATAGNGADLAGMRLSRNRNWAQPVTVDFIQDLSAFAATQPGWAGLYVGDMSQPRGGPMLTGHRSHQTGLDADIWMLPPARLT